MIVTGQSSKVPYQLAGKIMYPKGEIRAQVLELPYATSLEDLFVEWQALSEVTLGTKGLYHAMICPATGAPMAAARWPRSADILGEELGLLEPHQRALVLHDTGERAYLHAVWQRTNIDTWTLWDSGRNYSKHERASRRMEQEFGHPPPITKAEPQPPFNLDEGRQARRTSVRIASMNSAIAALMASAETPRSFKTALEEAGYILARGECGYVVVDRHGGVYSLYGQLRMKPYKLDEYMAPVGLAGLPDVDEAKERQYEISLANKRKGEP
jgi:MobA/VirD2-like, nuclease domain